MKLIPLKTAATAAYLKNKKIHLPRIPQTKLTYQVEGLTAEVDQETGETCSGDAIWIGRRNSYDAAMNLARKSAKNYYEVQVRAHDSHTELTHHWYLKLQTDGTITQDQIL